jgi:hypothetical protein
MKHRHRPRHHRLAALQLAGAAALTAPLVHADVRLTERVAVEGTGMMSLANMSGTTTTAISANSARMDNNLQMESRLARMFARDAGKVTEVVRLDDDVVLEIENGKKRYRQSSVSARRAQLEQASEQLRQAQAQQPMGAGLDDSQCEWSEPRAQTTKTGNKASFAGISAQQTTVVVKQSCKLRTNGAVCEVAIASDFWVAADFPGASEAQKFRRAYAEKLGLATGSGTFGQQAQSLLGRYPDAWKRLAEELGKVKGQPVKNVFSLEMDGAGCSASSGQNGQGGAGNPNPAEVASQIMGGLFGRKKAAEESAAAKPAPAGSSPSAVVILRLSTELTAIESGALDGSTFQAPPGFKKVEK